MLGPRKAFTKNSPGKGLSGGAWTVPVVGLWGQWQGGHSPDCTPAQCPHGTWQRKPAKCTARGRARAQRTLSPLRT